VPDALTEASPWRLLARFLGRHRSTTATVAGWSLVEALPALLSGVLVAVAVDRGFLAGRLPVGLAWLAALGAAMAVQAVVTRTVTPYLGKLVEPLRDELVTAVVTSAVRRAAAGARDGGAAGVARATGQTETVRQLVSALLRSARQLCVTLVMALIGVTALAAPLVLHVLVPVVLTLALCVPLLRALARRQRAQLLAEEDMTALAAATFAGMRDVVACGARDRAAAGLARQVDGHARAARATARAEALSTLLVTAGGWLPVLAVLLAAPRLLSGGALTVGALVGAVTYLATHVQPALRSLVTVLGSWGVELDTVLRRLAETTTGAERHNPDPRLPDGTHLTADRLTFAYGPGAVPVIRDLSLDLPPGAHLAVVGPSGTGKSTLAALVAGLAAPSGGSLRLGGVPVHAADRVWLARNVALIPQEAYVFTGTVRENLRYLRPDAPDEDVLRSARAVGAGPLLTRLGGLDAPLGLDGHDLSAGERQLVALARAHLSPARVVVLDEACCHLDPAAEARAEEAFAARGSTLLVVAHRISSALRADRVLVMDGDGTTAGTHHELLAASPLYARLVGHWGAAASRAGGKPSPPVTAPVPAR
jgi:ABC-type multidrug transport system fused ATPase/permease subunit